MNRFQDKLTKPEHIIWNLLTRKKFDQIPILREIQFKEHKLGKNVQLKDEDFSEPLNDDGASEHQNGSSKKNYKKKAE